jgi:hypothetical protein
MTPLERFELNFAPTLIDIFSGTQELIASNVNISKAARIIATTTGSISRAVYRQTIYTNKKTQKSYYFKLCKKLD